MSIFSKYGTRWARNKANIAALKEKTAGDPHGVYVLVEGSMPLYVGQGHIWKRIRKHNRGTKGRYWDHFSWFALDKKFDPREIEALLLRMLPFYLRSLNRQRTKFPQATKCDEKDPYPMLIKPPKLGIARKPRRRRR